MRVLLSHPDNPALRELINPQIPEEAFEGTVHKIAEMVNYFRAIARSNSNVEVRQIRSGCPHFQLTRSDQVALVIQYLYSESTHYSPLFQYPHGSPLYVAMARNSTHCGGATLRPSQPRTILSIQDKKLSR